MGEFGEKADFTTEALDTEGTFYYYCAVGSHCDLGQKVKVTVASAGMSGGACANPVFTAEQKTACEAAVAKCTDPATMVTCIQQEVAKIMAGGVTCGAVPEGKQYKAGQSATSIGTAETCF